VTYYLGKALCSVGWQGREASAADGNATRWVWALKQVTCRRVTSWSRTLFRRVRSKATYGFWPISAFKRDTFVVYVANRLDEIELRSG
jgi:hypothetical protein